MITAWRYFLIWYVFAILKTSEIKRCMDYCVHQILYLSKFNLKFLGHSYPKKWKIFCRHTCQATQEHFPSKEVLLCSLKSREMLNFNDFLSFLQALFFLIKCRHTNNHGSNNFIFFNTSQYIIEGSSYSINLAFLRFGHVYFIVR